MRIKTVPSTVWIHIICYNQYVVLSSQSRIYHSPEPVSPEYIKMGYIALFAILYSLKITFRIQCEHIGLARTYIEHMWTAVFGISNTDQRWSAKVRSSLHMLMMFQLHFNVLQFLVAHDGEFISTDDDVRAVSDWTEAEIMADVATAQGPNLSCVDCLCHC